MRAQKGAAGAEGHWPGGRNRGVVGMHPMPGVYGPTPHQAAVGQSVSNLHLAKAPRLCLLWEEGEMAGTVGGGRYCPPPLPLPV